MSEQIKREIALFENGVEYYRGYLTGNTDYKRGRIQGDIKGFSVGINFTVTLSNGKDKDGSWKPSTYIKCTAFKETADKIKARYSDKDEIEFIGKFELQKCNDKIYPKFIVREVIRMKPESEGSPDGDMSFEEDPNDPLPF